MHKAKTTAKNVFILGVSSDIGKALAELYLDKGYCVTGTYRHKNGLKGLSARCGMSLLKCDVGKKADIGACINKYRKLSSPWDIFISCVGTMEPICKFFDCDFDDWERSVSVNSLAQLRFLREIYPLRRRKKISHVVFFAGGGTNGPFTNYSAYCVSKIMLIKMCELLDDESKDINAFIVGPGWVRTKIHDQTLKSFSGAGDNYKRTEEFLKSSNAGTAHKDIHDCINWCIEQGLSVAGGRNFSVVHDPWRNNGGSLLARDLRSDPDKFKLRRFKNK